MALKNSPGVGTVKASIEIAPFNWSSVRGASEDVPAGCCSANIGTDINNAIALSAIHFRKRGISRKSINWGSPVQTQFPVRCFRFTVPAFRAETSPALNWKLRTVDRKLASFHLSNAISPLMVGALMKVRVVVMPKESVLDPQGVAVRNAVKEA